MAHLVALWKGDVPLGQAFWGYAIVYGTIANVVATAAAITAVAASLPDALAIGLFLVPIPYVLTAVIVLCAAPIDTWGRPCGPAWPKSP